MFAMQPPDGKFLFGRVIDTDANPLGVGGAILLYIYAARSSTLADIPTLNKSELLIPPLMTNRLPWSRGYFQFAEHAPLCRDDRLEQHCFVNTYGRFFDERGAPIEIPSQPIGSFGLQSFRTIDDRVSKALGIPLSED